jgi:hypothetical protein
MALGELTLHFGCTGMPILRSTHFRHTELRTPDGSTQLIARCGRNKDFEWTKAVRSLSALLITFKLTPPSDSREFVLEGTWADELYENLKHNKISTSKWMTRMFGLSHNSQPILARVIRATKVAGAPVITIPYRHLHPGTLSVLCDGNSITDPPRLDLLVNALRSPSPATAPSHWRQRWEDATLLASPTQLRVHSQPRFFPNHSPAVAEPLSARMEANESPDALLEIVDKFLTSTPISTRYLDINGHLNSLRREICILQDAGDPDGAIQLLKAQVKDCCIVAENYFTGTLAQASRHGNFLYACSSLLDTGYVNYLQDKGWALLLRRMGQAAKITRRFVIRVFFIDLGPIRVTDFNALCDVLALHLRSGVHVGLIDEASIPSDVRVKRNMACIGNDILLHATDQLTWDLDITTSKVDIYDAQEKHRYFMNHLALHLTPAEAGSVRDAVRSLFAVVLPDTLRHA